MIHSPWSFNVVLLFAHVFLGGMIFAHGYNKVFRGGKLKGTASWFASIGMKPGHLNAVMAAGVELAVGGLLFLGFFTPLAAAGLVSVMTVAIVTVHRMNGFFVFNKGQGIEYCLGVIVLSLLVGTVGSGKFSLDDLVRSDQPFRWFAVPSHAFVVSFALGFGAAALQLLAIYRPPRKAATD